MPIVIIRNDQACFIHAAALGAAHEQELRALITGGQG